MNCAPTILSSRNSAKKSSAIVPGDTQSPPLAPPPTASISTATIPPPRHASNGANHLPTPRLRTGELPRAPDSGPRMSRSVLESGAAAPLSTVPELPLQFAFCILQFSLCNLHFSLVLLWLLGFGAWDLSAHRVGVPH